MTLPVVFTANGPSGYNLTNSLRFRSSVSAYLNRTPASASNRKTWTWSGWVKRGTLGTTQRLFCAGTSDASSPFETLVGFTSADQLTIVINGNSGSIGGSATTSGVFRDPAAWYHVVAYVDMSASGQANKARIYVNGVLQTVTYSSLGTTDDTQVNNNVIHRIAANSFALSGYLDGYLTEVNFIDGQALTPSSFGETSTSTGVWIPKKYTGTYGTNGFYLPFTDNSALTTSSNVGLGKDFSGNANYWTTNNISITSGSTYDSMTDVPTLTSATAANYAVLNPLQLPQTAATSTSNGNLQLNGNTGSAYNSFANGTIFITSGKWYAEFQQISGTRVFAGISSFTDISTPNNWNTSSTYYINTGQIEKDGVAQTSGASWTTGDIIGVAYDADAATCSFYKNNSLQLTVTGIPARTYSFSVNGYTSGVIAVNFGQQPFTYTPPTGFNRLNTFNLPTPTIGATASTIASKNMNIALYTGTGSSQSITGLGFQPDWTWIKGRSGATDHGLYDAVRGVQKQLESNNNDAETTETTGLTAFGSDGFTVGALAQLNTSADTYVAWNWKANGAGVTNTAGTITSTVSANTTAGFSIVTYTGTGANATVGHGLGVAPSMVIVKRRPTAGSNWPVWHIGIANTEYLMLNSTNAKTTGLAWWNSTSPTSTVFSVGSDPDTNGTVAIVAYCFAPIAGYSAFGSYTGNGSTDGPFVYLGFRAKFLMLKCTSSGGTPWVMYDTSRNPSNAVTLKLAANNSEVENGAAVGTPSENLPDINSNGFKMRSTNTSTNGSGETIIYMAFAENPFKYANAR